MDSEKITIAANVGKVIEGAVSLIFLETFAVVSKFYRIYTKKTEQILF